MNKLPSLEDHGRLEKWCENFLGYHNFWQPSGCEFDNNDNFYLCKQIKICPEEEIRYLVKQRQECVDFYDLLGVRQFINT